MIVGEGVWGGEVVKREVRVLVRGECVKFCGSGGVGEGFQAIMFQSRSTSAWLVYECLITFLRRILLTDTRGTNHLKYRVTFKCLKYVRAVKFQCLQCTQHEK